VTRTRQFEIPAGPLSVVLAEIQRLAGLTIALANQAIGDVASPGVRGLFTPADGLARALEGTRVTARQTAPNSVTLEIRVTEEVVDVSVDAPQPRPSSPKYAQPLSEVPQTIEVIPRAVMEAQGVTTLTEALRNVPGISIQAGEGGGASSTTGDMFNLRGFSANNSLFVDGVRDDGLMSRDVYNLEQVEVFMGPTGSDVGRGNAAGYVNMQTKAPLAESAYAVTYAYGSGGQNRTTVDANHALPLGDQDSWLGRSAVRLNALWDEGGYPGREVTSRKNQSIAPSIALGINTATRVTGAVQITRQDNLPDYGIPGSAWTEYPLAPTTVIATDPVDTENFYGTSAYDSDKVEQDSYTARVEHDVNSNLTLRNQTRYNQTHRTAIISTVQNPAAFIPETQTVAIARQGNERENEITSNQTSLTTRFVTGRIQHAANAGLEFASEEQFAPTLGGVGTRNPAAVSIYSPNPLDAVTGYAPARTLAYNRGRRIRSRLCFDSTSSARDGSSAADCAGSTTTRHAGGRRDRRPHDRPHDSRRPVQRQGRPSLQADGRREPVRVLWLGGDAARHGELHAELAAEQPEQPQSTRRSRPTTKWAASWRLRQQPSVSLAAFRTETRTSSSRSTPLRSAHLQPGRRAESERLLRRGAPGRSRRDGSCRDSGISTRGRSVRTRRTTAGN
jgi:outer membrane receptor protein involved in Fe transport